MGDLAAGPRRHISLSQARRALLSNPSSSGDPLVSSPALPGGAGLMALLYGSRVHPVLHIWVSWTLNFSAFMRKVVVLTAHLCNAAFEVLLSTLFWTYLAELICACLTLVTSLWIGNLSIATLRGIHQLREARPQVRATLQES